MLLHHIVTMSVLYYLLLPTTSQYMKIAFVLSEASNLPMYLVYHLKSENYSNTLVMKLLIIVEALSFIILRLFWGSYILFQITFIDPMPILMQLSGSFIILISIIWSVNLLQQIIE